MNYSIKNKVVLVTGASGTVGRKLIEGLLDESPKLIYAVDHSEQGVFELENIYNRSIVPVIPLVADVRDKNRMFHLISEVDVVLHGAAIKHVPIAERAPFDAVSTNIIGLQNILNAALHHNIDRVLFMSSDKAANPTNVMGSTKLLGEKMTSALMNTSLESKKTVFFSTRFGNVVGSNGSVVNLFTDQILNGGPLTITSGEMTRFVMGIDEAVTLLIDSLKIAEGGEVYVMKMPSVRILDLAKAMIDHYGKEFSLPEIKIEHIGQRPGEKMYEELVTEEEVRRTTDEGDFFVIRPAFDRVFSLFKGQSAKVRPVQTVDIKDYRSDHVPLMSLEETFNFLQKHNLLKGV